MQARQHFVHLDHLSDEPFVFIQCTDSCVKCSICFNLLNYLSKHTDLCAVLLGIEEFQSAKSVYKKNCV